MSPQITFLSVLCLTIVSLTHAQVPQFLDPAVPAEERITALLAQMTLEEKINALSTNPSVPRLGVVGTGHVEGLHGLALGGPGGWEGKGQPVIPTTQFPQVRGLGQTWDPALIERAAAVEGLETRWAFNKYHRGGLVVRAPNADLSRDPRWGRSEESYGEDPFLVGTLATAFSRGLQDPDPAHWQTASLLKHFLANSNEDLRDQSSSNFDERLLHEYYSIPFRMAIEEGHADAMMTSYNSWNNVPMTANPVVRDVVFARWGFDGILCTDAGALTNMVKASHTYATLAEAAAAPIHAGINQFLDDYKAPVHDALARKLLTEADLDRNLRGVYRVMVKLGMLDAGGPYAQIGRDANASVDPWNMPASKALAKRVTEESIVLLKNTQGLLPLDATKHQSLAVIGPLADKVALDWYSGTPPSIVTPLEGLRARAGKVSFADGTDMAAAVVRARAADVAIVVIGNHPTCDAGWRKCPVPSDGKEAMDRKSLTLGQEELAKAVWAVNPRTIVVLQTSFPYTTTWTQEHVPAILEMAHNSQDQGTALANVLYGETNPGGRLTQTWVAAMDDLPPMMDYDLRHGRTYQYLKTTPLYAFGFGLSYTKFAYDHLKLSERRLGVGGTVNVSVDVQNIGTRTGDEVVQLYVAYPVSAVSRPQEQLAGFTRVTLKAGETRTVELVLPSSRIAFWDVQRGDFEVESGKIELRVGAASNDIRLHQTLEVAGSR